MLFHGTDRGHCNTSASVPALNPITRGSSSARAYKTVRLRLRACVWVAVCLLVRQERAPMQVRGFQSHPNGLRTRGIVHEGHRAGTSAPHHVTGDSIPSRQAFAPECCQYRHDVRP